MNKKTTNATAATKTTKAATGASRSSVARGKTLSAGAREQLERFYRQVGYSLGEEREETACAQASCEKPLRDEFLKALKARLDALSGTAKAGRAEIHTKRVQVTNRTYWRDGSGKRLVSEETHHEYRRSFSTER